jgi:hypothetical protein
MMIVIISLITLILISVVAGFVGSSEVSVGIEINKWTTPFFKLGIVSERYSLEDGSVEDEIGIHLLFVSFIVIFWKPLD